MCFASSSFSTTATSFPVRMDLTSARGPRIPTRASHFFSVMLDHISANQLRRHRAKLLSL